MRRFSISMLFVLSFSNAGARRTSVLSARVPDPTPTLNRNRVSIHNDAIQYWGCSMEGRSRDVSRLHCCSGWIAVSEVVAAMHFFQELFRQTKPKKADSRAGSRKWGTSPNLEGFPWKDKENSQKWVTFTHLGCFCELSLFFSLFGCGKTHRILLEKYPIFANRLANGLVCRNDS